MKISTRFLLLLACGAAALLAEDFWVKKPFTEWTPKEISKLVSDSPWAKEVAVPLGEGRGGMRGGGAPGGRGGSDTGAFGDASGGGDTGGGGRSGGGRGGRGGSGAGDTSEAPGGQMVQAAAVVVRWQTALPVREALILDKYGAEKAGSEEAKKVLAQDPPNYVIVMVGLPSGMLRSAAQGLKEGTSLVVKGKDPIMAENVQASQRGPVSDVYLVFPRKTPLTLEDKEVEFKCKLGKTLVQKKFKLKDMVVAGRLEL
jgi:hypothetical protein